MLRWIQVTLPLTLVAVVFGVIYYEMKQLENIVLSKEWISELDEVSSSPGYWIKCVVVGVSG